MRSQYICFLFIWVNVCFGHFAHVPEESLVVDIEALFTDVEMIAVVSLDEKRRFILEIEEVIYERPDSRIVPLDHDGGFFLDMRSEPYSPNNPESYSTAAQISGYRYLAFLRKVEDHVFEKGFIFSETRNFTQAETVQVVLGQDGFLILADRKSMQTSGLVEQYMSSINGDWENEQPAGWKNTFVNNCMSRVEAFAVDNGQLIYEAVKNYVAMVKAQGREAKNAIFSTSIDNAAFVKIFLSVYDVSELKFINEIE